jgi:hypothetical protein
MRRRMVRRLYIASLLLLSPLSDVRAGPYDGEWKGVATVTDGRCRPAVITLSVGDKAVVGEAKFERYTRNIHGTVTPDGEFGATIGFDHLTGKFVEDAFDGAFKHSGCTYKMTLRRTGR